MEDFYETFLEEKGLKTVDCFIVQRETYNEMWNGITITIPEGVFTDAKLADEFAEKLFFDEINNDSFVKNEIVEKREVDKTTSYFKAYMKNGNTLTVYVDSAENFVQDDRNDANIISW